MNAVAAGAAAAKNSFSLVITGAEGTRYTGRCTLTTAADEKTIELSGVVPRHEESPPRRWSPDCERRADHGRDRGHRQRQPLDITGATAQVAAR